MRKRRIFRLGAAAALACALSLSAVRAEESVEALWAQRADIARAREAIARYESEVARKPTDFGMLIRVSWLHYWVGMNLEPVAEGEAVSHFDKGEAFAESAIAADPGKAGGYFFRAANAARRMTVEGRLKSLMRASEVRVMAEKAGAIDRDYFYAGPDRLLCAYYTDLPGILGGNLKRAIERGRRAVSLHPEFAGNRVCLAEAYFKDGKNDLARKELELAIGTPDNAVAEAMPEQRLERNKAAELLNRIGK